MKIGIVSDTHGELQGIQRAIRVLDSLGVSEVIHCGDVGLETIPLLKGIRTHFVVGNVDDPSQIRESAVPPEHTMHGSMATLEIDGRRIACLHGHDVKLLHQTIQSGHWDLVCHGHTHVFSSSIEGRTRVVNPGALARTSHPSIAVVDLESLEVTHIPL